MRYATIALIVLLSACAGRSYAPPDFSGPFTGEGLGRDDGGGILQVQNAVGVVCYGRWDKTSDQEASAMLSCSNGRSGAVTFALSGRDGSVGTGFLFGQRAMVNLSR